MTTPADLIDRYTTNGPLFRFVLAERGDVKPTRLESDILAQMTRAAYSLDTVESELMHAAAKLEQLANHVRANILKHGEPRAHLDPNGELAGTNAAKLDALIAQRAALINQLQALGSVLTIQQSDDAQF